MSDAFETILVQVHHETNFQSFLCAVDVQITEDRVTGAHPLLGDEVLQRRTQLPCLLYEDLSLYILP